MFFPLFAIAPREPWDTLAVRSRTQVWEISFLMRCCRRVERGADIFRHGGRSVQRWGEDERMEMDKTRLIDHEGEVFNFEKASCGVWRYIILRMERWRVWRIDDNFGEWIVAGECALWCDWILIIFSMLGGRVFCANISRVFVNSRLIIWSN